MIASLTNDDLLDLEYDWPVWARPEQLPPEGDWQFWSYIGGRGAGKTRTGAEYVRTLVSEGYERIGLFAPTHDDFDKVMVRGESGILACSPAWNMPSYNESKKTLTWPNGAQAFGFSAEKPERIRGHQFDAGWADEIAAWQASRRQEMWDMIMFALRLGDNLKLMTSTTPVPVGVIRHLMESAINNTPGYVLTKSSTYANRRNLAKQFYSTVIKQYEGTRLGRQELLGELLLDIPGALWTMENITPHRVPKLPNKLKRVVVAVDPSGAYDKPKNGGTSSRDRENAASQEKNDEIGIVVAAEDYNDEYYVLDDASLLGGPDIWTQAAVDAYYDYGATSIIAETNYGGGMVINAIKRQDKDVRVKAVTASRGKAVRAAPIALLYEQGRVHHVGKPEKFAKLEDQFCKFTASGYTGSKSPDRADAAIWALSELSGQTGGRFTMGTGTS
jgi:phage terminase large subunit-like protein